VVTSSTTSFLATNVDLGTINQSTSTNVFVNTDTTALGSSTTDTIASNITTASTKFAPGQEDEGAYGNIIQGRPLAERYLYMGISRPEKRGPGCSAASSIVYEIVIVGARRQRPWGWEEKTKKEKRRRSSIE